MTLLSSCFLFESGYNINNDPILEDLAKEVKELEEARNKLIEETKKIEDGIADPEIDQELKESMRSEVFEAVHWKNKMFELIAYRKVRLRQRQELVDRRKASKEPYKEQAQKEVDEYFLNKKLHPMNKGWNDRFRAAIDL